MSDAHRDEITKLEALYAEHPEGRVFTHLAEACRKAGRLDRAREVLTEGIERHPDYSSAHVVLGRVLMDLDQHDEARAEFQRVLELDESNLVAIRSLGDVARIEGRTEEALAHYRELLDREPSDNEVREMVEALSEGRPVPGPDEAARVGTSSEDDIGVGEEPVVEEDAGEDDTFGEGFLEEEPEEAFEGDAPGEEPVFGHEAISEHLVAAEEPVADADPGAGEEPVSGDEAAIGDGPVFGREAVADEAAADDGSGVDEEIVLEEGGLEGGGLEEEPPFEEGALGEELAAEVEEAGEPAEGSEAGTGQAWNEDEWVAAASLDEIASDLEQLEGEGAEDVDVMTETIAQVYARQGLYDRAAEVYRELVRARPGDDALKERLARVEEQAAQAAAESGESGESGEPGTEPVGDDAVSGSDAGATDDEGVEPDGPVAGFEPDEVKGSPSDVEPLSGLEAREKDPETGLVIDDDEDRVTGEAEDREPADAEDRDAGDDEEWETIQAEGWDVAVDVDWEAEDTAEAEGAGIDDAGSSDAAASDPWDVVEDVDWAAADEAVEAAEAAEAAKAAAAEETDAADEADEADEADVGEGRDAVEAGDPDRPGAEVESRAAAEDERWAAAGVEDGEAAAEEGAEAAIEGGEADLEEGEAAVEAELEEAAELDESPWMGDAWSPADEAETPYAWAEPEEDVEDPTPPIRDYMRGVLDWGAAPEGPEGTGDTAGAEGPEGTGPPGAGDASVPEPEGGDGPDDDADLDMFRSWLESLKQ